MQLVRGCPTAQLNWRGYYRAGTQARNRSPLAAIVTQLYRRRNYLPLQFAGTKSGAGFRDLLADLGRWRNYSRGTKREP